MAHSAGSSPNAPSSGLNLSFERASASITGIESPESIPNAEPPPVLLWLTSPAIPRWLTNALVCPPPTIVTPVASAHMLRISMVPKANSGNSKYEAGPFHSTQLAPVISGRISINVWNPMS